MSNLELKEKIIKRVRESDNQDLLNEVVNLLNIEQESLEVYKLSIEQKEGINEARAEIQKGKFISNEKSDDEIDEWLKK